MKLIKILAIFTLMVLLSSSVFAIYKTEGNKEFYIINIQKGWNTIPSFTNAGITSSSEITQDDIKAMYIFDIEESRYVKLFPQNPTGEAFKLSSASHPVTMRYYDHAGQWVFSRKAGNMVIQRMISSPTSQRLPMLPRWNFITITPDMVGKSFAFMSGSCNFAGMAIWDAANQRWLVFNDEGLTNALNQHIEESSIGNVILLKPAESCTTFSA